MAGGKTGRTGQKYQNTFAFKHNKNSKKTAMILSIQHSGLCKRCDEKIEWRKKFRKYKPIKNPKKCAKCDELKVHRAYHTICNDCANTRQVCCMCLSGRDQDDEELDEELIGARRATGKEIRAYLSSLREREKRRIVRKHEEGSVRFYVQEDGSLLMKEISKQTEEDDQSEDNEDSEVADNLEDSAQGQPDEVETDESGAKKVRFEELETEDQDIEGELENDEELLENEDEEDVQQQESVATEVNDEAIQPPAANDTM